MQDVGVYAIIHIIVHVACVCISFYAVQSLRTDQWFKANHVKQVQIFLIFLSIALGSLVSNFIMDIIYFSKQMTWM